MPRIPIGRAGSIIANTNTNSDPGFIEGSELKTNIDQTMFWNLGMRAIPVNEIGLYADAAHAGWLDKPENGYWNGGSGKLGQHLGELVHQHRPAGQQRMECQHAQRSLPVPGERSPWPRP